MKRHFNNSPALRETGLTGGNPQSVNSLLEQLRAGLRPCACQERGSHEQPRYNCGDWQREAETIPMADGRIRRFALIILDSAFSQITLAGYASL